MQLIAITFGLLTTLGVAAPTGDESGLSVPAYNIQSVTTEGDNHCFPQETPTQPATPLSTCGSPRPGRPCDETCRNYRCCDSVGCHCRSEILAEFEQIEAQLLGGNRDSDNNTASSKDAYCDPICSKYRCCDDVGCHCLAEVLDELERDETLRGDAKAALRNIHPRDIDLGSEANMNFKCIHPCGPESSGCCFFQEIVFGPQCICPMGVSASLDEHHALRHPLRKPPQKCTPDCQGLYDDWKSCNRNSGKDFCDRELCRLEGMKKCDYPVCQAYATCIPPSSEPTQGSI